jgi:sec-independent protein translocase protein TatB
MFNIGAGEMIFILVAALLILGPSRLPEMARGIGKFLREFRRQTDEVRTVVTREFYQMDQEIQREPVRSTPPPAASASAQPEQASLPPLGLPPAVDSGPYAHMMPSPVTPVGAPVEPAEPVPAPGAPAVEPVAAQASVAGVQAAAQAGAPEAAAPGQSSEEEAVPRFAPIPGTVARNAPKQS